MSRKKKTQSVKNPEAFSVRTRRFRSKVIQSKKLYNRKKEKIISLNAAAQNLTGADND